MNDLPASLRDFYTKALTVNTETTPSAVLERVLADSFVSINSQESKAKAVLMKQVEGFWKLIPDLRWEPHDVIVSGNKVVVRSVATGSPSGPFMGALLDGTRSFKIDTTDIHELEAGRVARVHHLEDWATGMRQLTATPPNHAIEVATFRTKPGVGDAQLLAAEKAVRAGRIARMPGFISRELGKDGDGSWVVIMRFHTRAQVDAWLAEVKSVPEMREYGALLDTATMAMRSFSRHEP
jgi:predicted ester cyclase